MTQENEITYRLERDQDERNKMNSNIEEIKRKFDEFQESVPSAVDFKQGIERLERDIELLDEECAKVLDRPAWLSRDSAFAAVMTGEVAEQAAVISTLTSEPRLVQKIDERFDSLKIDNDKQLAKLSKELEILKERVEIQEWRFVNHENPVSVRPFEYCNRTPWDRVSEDGTILTDSDLDTIPELEERSPPPPPYEEVENRASDSDSLTLMRSETPLVDVEVTAVEEESAAPRSRRFSDSDILDGEGWRYFKPLVPDTVVNVLHGRSDLVFATEQDSMAAQVTQQGEFLPTPPTEAMQANIAMVNALANRMKTTAEEERLLKASKLKQLPVEKFSGEEDPQEWNAWIAGVERQLDQFYITDQQRRATLLLERLEGEARATVREFATKVRPKYDDVKERLKERFDNKSSRQEARFQLRHVEQGETETYDQLGTRIECLVLAAHGHNTGDKENMKEEIVETFCRAIKNRTVQIQVAVQDHEWLRQAVEAARRAHINLIDCGLESDDRALWNSSFSVDDEKENIEPLHENDLSLSHWWEASEAMYGKPWPVGMVAASTRTRGVLPVAVASPIPREVVTSPLCEARNLDGAKIDSRACVKSLPQVQIVPEIGMNPASVKSENPIFVQPQEVTEVEDCRHRCLNCWNNRHRLIGCPLLRKRHRIEAMKKYLGISITSRKMQKSVRNMQKKFSARDKRTVKECAAWQLKAPLAAMLNLTAETKEGELKAVDDSYEARGNWNLLKLATQSRISDDGIDKSDPLQWSKKWDKERVDEDSVVSDVETEMQTTVAEMED